MFLSYWPLRDGLTTSTVFHHLRLLQEWADVEAVRLVTIERAADAQAELCFEPDFPADKITFAPLRSRPGAHELLTKIEDFTRFPDELLRQATAFKADFILARSAPAGALAYLVWQKSRLPVPLPPGVSDDSTIAKAEGGGAVFDLTDAGSLKTSFVSLWALLADSDHRTRIHRLAVRHRSLAPARATYAALLPIR